MPQPPEIEEIAFDDSDALRDISLAIAQNCHRNLDIISRHLDPPIYDNAPFYEAVKAVALNNRAARIRLLVTDVRPVISRGHRLIDLCNRLSSFIEIRKPNRDYRNFNEAMLLADNRAYIHRRFADRYEGMASHDDLRRTQDLMSQFEEVWSRAELEANFRRLHV